METDKEIRRLQRLQVMLAAEELRAIDAWRFKHSMPSRAAAIRSLIRRGLSTTDDPQALANSSDRTVGSKSQEFGVIRIAEAEQPPSARNAPEDPE